MTRSERLAAFAAAVEGVQIIDHESCLQLLDADGCHLALASLDPLQIEVDLSAVFVEDDGDDERLIEAAVQAITDVHRAVWQPRGFVLGTEGELSEGELVDDPDTIVRSFEIPVTVRVDGLDAVGPLLAWVADQQTDFAV